MLAQPQADRIVEQVVCLLAVGATESAETALKEALRLDPRHPMALTQLAELLLRRKAYAQAAALLDAALATEPNFAPAWAALSQAYWLAGNCHIALSAIRRAFHIQPHNPSIRLQLAQLAGWMGHPGEAHSVLAPLLATAAGQPAMQAAAIGMRGELAIADGRFVDANRDLCAALRAAPGLSATRMMLGINQLRLGNFTDGWRNYAAREHIESLNARVPGLTPEKAWQGQDLTRKSILVTDDQGHGDAIQFFRYQSVLRSRGASSVTLFSFAPLLRLLAPAAPYATVMDGSPNLTGFDWCCTSSSLPRWCGTTANTIPASVAYLPTGETGKRPRTRRLQIGLAWSGDPRHMRDHLRSIPAAQFLTLADHPGADFHSLQIPVRPSDLPALTARPEIRREVEAAVDFADTAAVIAGLDLVITVDTAVAHLAGALGKPVWIVLHATADWRWMTDRENSPWYPTARLFRVTRQEWLADFMAATFIDAEACARLDTVRDDRTSVPRTCPDHARKAVAADPERGWGPVLGRVAQALREHAERRSSSVYGARPTS